MKLKSANTIVILAILIGMASHVYAQKHRASYHPKAWYIGAESGGNIFFGDIKYSDYLPNLEYKELTFGGGLNIGKHLSEKFILKGNFHYSKLSGTKKTTSLLRTFKTTEQDASLRLQLNIFQVFNRRPNLHKLSVWGEVGVGAIRWQSLLYNTNTGDTINNLHWNAKEYETALMIPMGLNIKYYLNKNISADLYSGLRFVNSDFLDAKDGGIKFDYYWYSGAAINYHFGFKDRATVVSRKRRSDELQLLDYLSIDPFDDPELAKTVKKEQEEEILEPTVENPYSVEFIVPGMANNKRFQVLIKIYKSGILGNGFFRLQLPSGFYPAPQQIKEVTYTRIAYNYDFDFYLPKEKDTLLIPIDITISEREDNTYPLFIEGEIMNQNGELFAIKNAQYVEISENAGYNDFSEKTVVDAYDHPDNVSEQKVEAVGNKTYRIQILACRKPSEKVDAFLKKHQIDQKVYLWEAGGWWRYSIYQLSSLKEAKEYLQKVRNNHQLKDAFIVEFENGKRIIPGNQAKKINTVSSKATNNVQKSSSLNVNRPVNPQKINTYQSANSTKPSKRQNTEDTKKKIVSEQPKVQPKETFEPVVDAKNISVYRIEIAVSPAYPIPLRQLQNWVANEKISEWTYKDDYRYTIGRFENEQVARAFLQYVRLQFALPDAHMVVTKGTIWQRVVR